MGDDPFSQQTQIPQTDIVADRSILRSLGSYEVIVRRFGHPAVPNQYFRVMFKTIPITVDSSGHFYEQDEYAP